MACYIRQKEGDCLVESGEFAETQVQRPPDQHSSIPRICRLKPPFFSKGLRERGWGFCMQVKHALEQFLMFVGDCSTHHIRHFLGRVFGGMW